MNTWTIVTGFNSILANIRTTTETHIEEGNFSAGTKGIDQLEKVQEFIIKNLHKGIVDIQSASDAMNMDRSTFSFDEVAASDNYATP